MKKITTKFLIRFLLISIIPILILGFASSYYAMTEIRNSIYSEMKVSVEQIGIDIERKFEKIDDQIFKLISDRSLQTILIDQNNYQNISFTYPLTDKLNSVLFTHFGEYEYIDVCILSNKSGKMFTYIDKINCDMETISAQPWFSESKKISNKNYILSNKTISNIYGEQSQKLAIAFPITNLVGGNPIEIVGYIFLTFSDMIFTDSYQSSDDIYDSTIHIYNNRNELISFSDNSFTDIDFSKYISDGEYNNEYESILKYDKANKIYVCKYTMPYYNYTILKIIPYSILTRKISNIYYITFFAGTICIFLAIVLSKIVSRNITQPLLELNDSMKSFEKGDFSSSVTVTSDDEIGQIQNRYNKMVVRIKSLFNQTVEVEKNKRIEELKALQYQINPHFLYNTLNSVRFMAMISKCENVSEMLETLIRLLRNVMGKMGEMVSVSEEINNVKDYIYIQNIRYAQNIKVVIKAEEDIERYLVPNFILQPVVENSIFHGIEPKKNQGKIIISVYKIKKELYIEIEDNGIGMSEEEIKNIMDRSPSQDGAVIKIGVNNTNNRIKLNYGNEYGINITSEIGSGTKVMFNLPLVLKGGEEDV